MEEELQTEEKVDLEVEVKVEEWELEVEVCEQDLHLC